MDETKSRWQSVTFWTGTITSAVSLLAILGFSFAPELIEEINVMVVAGFTLVSGVLTVFGRFRATTSLT